MPNDMPYVVPGLCTVKMNTVISVSKSYPCFSRRPRS